jgi:DNA-binding protein H-NS
VEPKKKDKMALPEQQALAGILEDIKKSQEDLQLATERYEKIKEKHEIIENSLRKYSSIQSTIEKYEIDLTDSSGDKCYIGDKRSITAKDYLVDRQCYDLNILELSSLLN